MRLGEAAAVGNLGQGGSGSEETLLSGDPPRAGPATIPGNRGSGCLSPRPGWRLARAGVGLERFQTS